MFVWDVRVNKDPSSRSQVLDFDPNVDPDLEPDLDVDPDPKS